MSFKRLLEKIEERATQEMLGIDKVCQHGAAQITYPSGRTERLLPCRICDLPRLRISIDYDGDAISPRIIIAAKHAFAESKIKFPEHSEDERRKVIAEAFRIPETLL